MLTQSENLFVLKTIRRQKLYLALSIGGVIIGLSMTVYYFWKGYTHTGFDIGIHFLIVVLILLNARQNFRQYRYAKIFDKKEAFTQLQ